MCAGGLLGFAVLGIFVSLFNYVRPPSVSNRSPRLNHADRRPLVTAAGRRHLPLCRRVCFGGEHGLSIHLWSCFPSVRKADVRSHEPSMGQYLVMYVRALLLCCGKDSS